MNNPWLEIPHSDYDSHMEEVGQSQILNELMAKYLAQYQPERFALLGCSTGNGLEHIDNSVQKEVYAMDINAEYLEQLKQKFTNEIDGLYAMQVDIESDHLAINNIDLVFIGLVLEYVNPKIAIEKVKSTLCEGGKLIIVIQKNNRSNFVSKTNYSSLEKLSCFHADIEDKELTSLLKAYGFKLYHKEEIKVNDGKSFILYELDN